MRKLISDNLNGYKDASLRKNYLWLEKELNRIKKVYLEANGIQDLSEIKMVVTTKNEYDNIMMLSK